MTEELAVILAEQQAAAEYLLAHPGDSGAVLWLADWVWEEIEFNAVPGN